MKRRCLTILVFLLIFLLTAKSASAANGKVYPLVFRTEAPTPEVTEAPATEAPIPVPEAPTPEITGAPAPEATEAPVPEAPAEEASEETAVAPPAPAEEPETLPEPEMTAAEAAAGRTTGGAWRLPLDLSPGMKLHKANYNTKYHYQDPTIEMDTREEKNGEVRYWIAEIRIQDATQLRTMPANSFERSNNADGERLSHRAQAVLACNGDYWYRDVQWKGSYVLRQGKLYMHHLTGTDLLLVNEDGDFRIIHEATEGNTPLPKTEDGPVYYEGKQIYNGFCFGPALIEDGKVLRVKPNDKMETEKKRTRMAICQMGKLHYAVICTGKGNMTLQEFADMLGTMEIQTAYNLDGGASAMLMTDSTMLNVNPSTRDLSDIIYFASAWPGEGK